MNKQFTKRETPTANNCTSNLLVIRAMQIKTMRWPLNPLRIAKLERWIILGIDEDMGRQKMC